MAGRVKDGEYSSEDSADEYLCEYEKKRLENIKKNHELLRSLGKRTLLYLNLIQLLQINYGCLIMHR